MHSEEVTSQKHSPTRNSGSIGVCIFAHNEANHILETLRSVSTPPHLAESITQICVVDDGSTDDTAAIVRSFMEGHRNTYLIQHSSNLGISEALRTGMAYLSTDYVLLLPGDYTYDADAIARVLRLRRETPPAVALILGVRDKARERRSHVREVAAWLSTIPFVVYTSSARRLPSVGLILFERRVGLLLPTGVVGYGQGIGLLGTMICSDPRFVSVSVQQVPGSAARGSSVTLRKILDVAVSHWSLLRSRKEIALAAREIRAQRDLA